MLNLMCCFYSILFISLFPSQYSTSSDKITVTKLLKDPETLVSKNGVFEMGFFSPANSTNRYLGIWYGKLSKKSVVWVANRNNPLNDSSRGEIRISEDGNLQVLNVRNETVWSTDVILSNQTHVISEAQLLDSGNLVLMGPKGRILWQSFQYPTDTALPNMKLIVNKNSDIMHMLQAWNGPSDPSYGRFSVGIDSFALPQIVIFDGDRPYWRSGPWNGHIFNGIQNNESDDFSDAAFILENDRLDTISLTYSYTNKSLISNYDLSYQGTLTQKWWDENKREWKIVWEAPETQCDIYGKCGAFGICNSIDSPICQCMKGFEPKNKSEWNMGDWRNGCMRRAPFQCKSRSGKEEGFFGYKAVKVPNNADWSMGLEEKECKNQCLANCSCLAYVYDYAAGCMTWDKDLIDTKQLSTGGMDLYLKLAHSELGKCFFSSYKPRYEL